MTFLARAFLEVPRNHSTCLCYWWAASLWRLFNESHSNKLRASRAPQKGSAQKVTRKQGLGHPAALSMEAALASSSAHASASLVPWTENRCFGCPSGEPSSSNPRRETFPEIVIRKFVRCPKIPVGDGTSLTMGIVAETRSPTISKVPP
jgi:hypothetical protein